MTSITKSAKQEFVSHVANKLKAGKIEALEPQMMQLADSIYRSAISEEQEAIMRKLPAGFTLMVDEVRLDYNLRLPLSRRCPEPYSIANSCHFFHNNNFTDYRINVLVEAKILSQKAGDKLSTEIEAFKAVYHSIESELDVFRQSAWALLDKVRTLKALKKAWPEVYDEFLKVTGLSEETTNLPMVPLAIVNDQMAAYFALNKAA